MHRIGIALAWRCDTCDARIYRLYRTHRGKKHVFTKKEGLKKYNNGILRKNEHPNEKKIGNK
jgi:hypothetical protein